MKHTLASLVIGLSLLMGTATGAWAQDFERGLRAFRSGDYATALREWRTLAESGGAVAQGNLGILYHIGFGVAQDFKEAAKWYRLAAEQGHSTAQNNLGAFYQKGLGVVQDYKEAMKLYRLSAEQGLDQAQLNLGDMYKSGLGVIQDNVMAHMWLNIAASNGDTRASAKRDFLAQRMTAADISKAQQLARECVAKNYKGC